MRRIKSIWGRLPDHARPLCNISSRTENGVWPLCFIHIIIQQNQKKVLALVLAFACAFTMFAGAAFTDQADITVDAEVVDTLVALGVIEGYTDGSFRPDDTVTRAEMAKMIYTVRTGRSDASAYNDDATSFTDIGDHWARGYIKYCNSMGIIAGHSATRFAPDDTVTTQEAAKMLLVTLGYDAERAGLTGAGWGSKTNALADENGLLEDVINGTTQGMPRQYAAQLIFNAINASTVVWRDDAYTNTSYQDQPNQTIGEKYMGLENPEGILTSVKYDDNDGVYDIAISGVEALESDTDYSALMGQEVQALYKETRTGDIELYGLFATEKNKTVTAIYDDADISVSSGKNIATINKTDYDITGITTIATNGTVIDGDDYGAWTNFPYAEVTLVDNDNDKVYEYAVVNPFKVAQVTSVTTKKIYFDNSITDDVATNVNIGSVDVDDLDAYEGLAEDDYVMLTEAAYSVSGNVVAAKAETVSGKVSGTKSDGSIQIDGAWYKKAAASVSAPNAGDELDYAVVANGFYFATEGATGSADKLALVLKVGSKDFDGDYSEVKLLLSDGTTKTTKAYVKDGTTKEAPVLKTLYTYTENADGYVLKKITAAGDIGMDSEITGSASVKYNSQTNKVGTTRLAADAKVFVLYEQSSDSSSYKGKLITGAEADKWTDNQYWFTKAYVDGNVKVLVASMGSSSLPNAADDSAYGVVLSEPYTSQDDEGNTIYVIDSFLTESGIVSITVADDEYNTVNVKKNALVTYKMSGDDYVDFGETPSTATAIVGAVTDVDGDYVTVKTSSTTVELNDDDTTVLGFDSDAGIEGSNTIREANKKDATNYYANILVVYEIADGDSDGAHVIWGAAVDAGNMLLDEDGDEILIAVS